MFFIRNITLTAADTNYRLYTLLNAADSRIPARCAEIQIQAATANTAKVLIGDGGLSGSVFGKELNAESSTTIGAGSNSNTVPLKNLWARSASAGQVLNIIVRVA